jgi:flagellar assembly protein FliH
MSPRRHAFIPAEKVDPSAVQAFPYQAVNPTLLVSSADPADDAPIGAQLSTEEETLRRLSSVDQQIYERMQEADRKAQEIEREAFEKGFAAGEAEGRAFGESLYKGYIQRLEAELKELAEVTAQVREARDEEMLALCLAVGEHLAAQQINQSPQAVRTLVDRVLEELPFPIPRTREAGERPLILYLHPQDLEQLGDHYVGNLGLRLVEDPALSRGSLRMEAESGILDGTLERRRQRMLELVQRLSEK